MVHYRRSGSESYISTVNITPFTDVALVILIVFMVSAPGILSSAIDIHLPTASSSVNQDKNEIRIGIDKNGILYLNQKKVTKEELEKEVMSSEDLSGKNAVINADSGASHGTVVEILDMLRKAGLKGVYVGTVRK